MITIFVKKAGGFEKLVGLIGKKKAYPVLLKTRFGIHTFGMKFPIDVLILDKQNKVVSIKKELKPNRICMWNPRYSTIVELSGRTINKRNIKIGDKIKLSTT